MVIALVSSLFHPIQVYYCIVHALLIQWLTLFLVTTSKYDMLLHNTWYYNTIYYYQIVDHSSHGRQLYYYFFVNLYCKLKVM